MRLSPTQILVRAKTTLLAACIAAGGALLMAPTHAAAQSLVAIIVQADGTAPVALIDPTQPAMRWAPVPIAIASPFAMMQRMEAEMDRQQEAMLRLVASLHSTAVPLGDASVCTQIVQITDTGGQPQITERTSGNCGPAMRAVPTRLTPRPRAPSAHTVLARGNSPAYAAMEHPVVLLSER
jgi:hypothetical protein